MTDDLNQFTYTDQLHDVLAAYVNELVASNLRGKLTNTETLTGTKTMTDASLPIQNLTPSGAHRNILLPAEAITNHQYVIKNASGTYNLVVKDDGGGTTFATIMPGQAAPVIPIGGLTWVVMSGISDHGMLSGLGDDDHSHYHNDARGDARYAQLANGVTNGNSHDHAGGDGGQIDHGGLNGLGDNDHPQYANKLSVSSVSPTTANISAAVNTRYLANIAGLTNNRQFILPAGTVGDEIELVITNGDDVYSLVVLGNTGITINGGSAATEWSRLFITDEVVRFTATSSSNWRVAYDGRIPCKGVMTRITSAGNTTHSAGADVVADWNNIEVNVGDIADLANDRFNIRRAGYYAGTGSYAPASGIADQQYAAVMLFKNTTKIAAAGLRQSSASPSSLLTAVFRKPVLFAAGDYMQYKFNAEAANIGLGRTDSPTAVLEAIAFFAIEEILP